MSLFQYKEMYERMDALERLDLTFHWGPYDIRVLHCHLVQFSPGKIINFHMHAEYEFHFIPGGKGTVILEDTQYPLGPGMFYLTGPNVLHYQEADMREPMEELCLHIDIVKRPASKQSSEPISRSSDWEELEAVNCIEKLQSLPTQPAMDKYMAMSCFVEAYRAAQHSYIGSYTTIKQAIIQILLRSVRAYEKPEEDLLSIPTRNMKQYRYKLAIEYIRTNYAQQISIDDVAQNLRLSTRQLQRLLKEMEPTQSFSQIVEVIRLSAVCKQLLASDASIEAIALQCGFSSGNYLHSVFKQKYGITPAQYRLENQPRINGSAVLQLNEGGAFTDEI
ncbi:AraC family transcriptional regulator [Paenibacillus sp. GXUN7292]|uniref:cupin domain-containing protein n=1 Tax=Paenibacillus sp. GXUN7292 TaxID=3422499 RepID=UPI003D7E6B00